ncbi:MAG TPA: metal ABC transporter ATP-binding protein [Nitrospirota bacterium]|nr:metal ABC transporter ATP-binding protein [Nitrospirota bacterium]
MQVDHTNNIIEVENVSFAYNGDDVLENITLDIHRGDYIGIIGPNGAGKTTLFKIMLGLLRPRTGSVKLFGQDIKNFREWRKIGYVPQKAINFDAQFPATAFEVVSMGLHAKIRLFKKAAEDRIAVQNALEQVDMVEHKDRLIGDLSGGQQQRVFLARALVHRPEVIFLDEPTAGVDTQTQAGFYEMLQKLNNKLGITLLLVSHDIGRITKEVMHIACVDRGLTCHATLEEYLREIQSADMLKVKVVTHHHHH